MPKNLLPTPGAGAFAEIHQTAKDALTSLNIEPNAEHLFYALDVRYQAR